MTQPASSETCSFHASLAPEVEAACAEGASRAQVTAAWRHLAAILFEGVDVTDASLPSSTWSLPPPPPPTLFTVGGALARVLQRLLLHCPIDALEYSEEAVVLAEAVTRYAPPWPVLTAADAALGALRSAKRDAEARRTRAAFIAHQLLERHFLRVRGRLQQALLQLADADASLPADAIPLLVRLPERVSNALEEQPPAESLLDAAAHAMNLCLALHEAALGRGAEEHSASWMSLLDVAHTLSEHLLMRGRARDWCRAALIAYQQPPAPPRLQEVADVQRVLQVSGAASGRHFGKLMTQLAQLAVEAAPETGWADAAQAILLHWCCRYEPARRFVSTELPAHRPAPSSPLSPAASPTQPALRFLLYACREAVPPAVWIEALRSSLQRWNAVPLAAEAVLDDVHFTRVVLTVLQWVDTGPLDRRRVAATAPWVVEAARGVEAHLQSGVPEVRFRGMLVGEMLSAAVDERGAQLRFDITEYEEWKRVHAADLYAMPTAIGKRAMTGADAEVPMAGAGSDTRGNDKTAPGGIAMTDTQGDEDDLMPYPLPPEEVRAFRGEDVDTAPHTSSPPLPYSYATLASALNRVGAGASSESSATPLRLLQSLEALLRRDAPGLDPHARALLSALLRLHLHENEADEEALRERLLQEICRRALPLLGVSLATEVYDQSVTMNRRFRLLNLLMDAALHAEEDRSATEAASATAASAASPREAGDSPTPAFDTKTAGRVRRMLTRSLLARQRQATSASPPGRSVQRQGETVARLFYTLTAGLARPVPWLDLRGTDQPLWALILQTLAVLLHTHITASGRMLDTEGASLRMARTLAALAYDARTAHEPAVRQAAAWSVVAVAQAVAAAAGQRGVDGPAAGIAFETEQGGSAVRLQSLVEWLLHCQTQEPDAATRTAAATALSCLARTLEVPRDA
eukprot:ctg_333.g164